MTIDTRNLQLSHLHALDAALSTGVMLVRNSQWTRDLLDELAEAAKFLNNESTVRPLSYSQC